MRINEYITANLYKIIFTFEAIYTLYTLYIDITDIRILRNI